RYASSVGIIDGSDAAQHVVGIGRAATVRVDVVLVFRGRKGGAARIVGFLCDMAKGIGDRCNIGFALAVVRWDASRVSPGVGVVEGCEVAVWVFRSNEISGVVILIVGG